MDRRGFLAACGMSALGGCLNLSSGNQDPLGTVECADGVPERSGDGLDGGSWPTLFHDAQNTSFTSVAGPQGCVETQWRWSYTKLQPPGFHTSPIVHRQTLYIADGSMFGQDKRENQSLMIAFNDRTGEERWRFSESEWQMARQTPTLHKGVIYLSVTSELFAIDVSTRELHWSQRLIDPGAYWIQIGVPRVVNKTVYLGSNQGILFAVDVQSGDKQWTFETEGISTTTTPTGTSRTPTSAEAVGSIYEPVAVAEGFVYASSWDRQLYALDAATGTEQWQFSIEGKPNLSDMLAPTVDEGRIYVQTKDARLFVLDAATGEQIWKFDELGRASNGVSPAVDDRTVYFVAGTSTQNLFLYALDKKTEDALWRTSIGLPHIGPSVDANSVYLAHGRHLYSYDKRTGEANWRVRMATESFSQAAIVEGAVYVTDADGHLFGLW